MAERSQPGDDYDDLTYVQHIRTALAHIPRALRFVICITALAYGLLYGQAWLFYGSIICVTNYVMMKAEYWTAGRDERARAAGVATHGWGLTWRTQDPWGPFVRIRQDMDVRKNATAR